MAGSVIQATRTGKFEDGLFIGNHLKAQNGLQRANLAIVNFFMVGKNNSLPSPYLVYN